MSFRKLRRRIRAWGRRQLYSFFSSLGTLLSHRVGTLMTVLVLGIAMALPLGLHVTVKNLRALDVRQQDWGTITVFMQTGIAQERARALAGAIEQQQSAAVRVVSPDDGMEEFRQASGFGQAMELFEDNPLPWVLQVTPQAQEGRNLEQAALTLGGWLEGQPGVDFVQVDYRWLQRLERMLGLGNALVTVLSVLFSLAVFVVVANTIRLDVANRAEEIQVLHLVGASGRFIRQPFLYSGFWYGLLGAVLALALLGVSLLYLQNPLERLLDAYGNTFSVSWLGGREVAMVLLGGGALGLLGAWTAVDRYLGRFRLEDPKSRR
jgi:cell division transport system permease protein